MTCRELRAIAGDLARGRGIGAETARDAAAHAAECAGCAARLDSDRAVSEALSALAGAVKGRGAPAHVEAALMAAFAQRAQRRRVARAPWRRLAVAAAAAVAVVAASMWLRAPQRSPEPAPAPAQAKPAPVVAAVEAPREAPRPVARRRSRRPLVRPQAPKARREVATQFYPLRYLESDAELTRSSVVRVQVPRATLVTFGLPVDYNRAYEPVQADLVLDETGMARAIRFVRQQ